MLIQINSGKGPMECEIAVQLFLNELCKEYPKLRIISENRRNAKLLFSVILESEEDLSFLEGSIQWICQSPLRPHHKRKNWFIDVSILQEEQALDEFKDIRFEVLHSSGKGGQHVNKTATAVRAIHLPTGITTVCMEERSQLMNKKKALEKLKNKLNQQLLQSNQNIQYDNWNQHNNITRGNPIRIYKGMSFQRIK